MEWNERFLDLYAACLTRYRAGDRDYTTYYTEPDLAFLSSIGYKPREFYDFVEDFGGEGVPAPSTALLVASVRRDYFLTVQKGVPFEGALVSAQNLPSFGEMLDNIPYLPRIIAKAKAKLIGSLDPDVMFCCGGDRNFLKQHGEIDPADFLRHVWASHGDDAKVVSYVREKMKQAL